MSTEARCHQCGKMLGTTDDCNSLEVSPIASRAQKGELVFTVKCRRCGKLSHIKFHI